jgi:hypothetical protein
MIADLKALTDCQCVVVGGSIGLADGYLPLVKDYLAHDHALAIGQRFKIGNHPRQSLCRVLNE